MRSGLPPALPPPTSGCLQSDEERLRACFDAAESGLGVPKLLNEVDVASGAADQLSVVAYVGKLRKGLQDADARAASLAAEARAEAESATAQAALEAAEAERAAEEKKEAERVAAAAKVEAERLAEEKARAEKAAAEKAAAELAAAAAAEALAKAAEEEKQAAAKAAAEAKAAEAKAAAEKAAAETAAAEARAAEKEAAEKAAAEMAEEMARAAARAKRAAAVKRRMSVEAAEKAAAALSAAAAAAAMEAAEAEAAAAKAAAAEAAIAAETPLPPSAQSSFVQAAGTPLPPTPQASTLAAGQRRHSRTLSREATAQADAFLVKAKEAEAEELSAKKRASVSAAAAATAAAATVAAVTAILKEEEAKNATNETRRSLGRQPSFVESSFTSRADYHHHVGEEKAEAVHDDDEEEEQGLPTRLSSVHYIAPSPLQTDKATEEVAAVAAAVAATSASAAMALPDFVPSEWAASTVIIDKKELATTLGVVLSNVEDDAHPVVVSVKSGGAAATPACQLQDKLMEGDRILSLEAATAVVRLQTSSKVGAVPTAALLKRAVGVLKIVVRRGGETLDVDVEKSSANDPLGIELTSSSGEKHPVVSSVVDRFTKGVAAEKLVVGDVVLSVEAATEFAKLETRHAAASHSVATGFLKAALGPVAINVHRMQDAGKREAATAEVLAQVEQDATDIATTDTNPVVAATITTRVPSGLGQRRATSVFCADTKATEAEARDELADAPPAASPPVDVTDAAGAFRRLSVGPDNQPAASDAAQTKRGSSVIAQPQSAMAQAVAATAATSAAPAKALAPAGTEKVTVVVNKEDFRSKLGVTLSSESNDAHPVVVKLAKGGAAATAACQLQGKLMEGDRILSISGYTQVVHLDTVAQWSAVTTASMLNKSVGLVKFIVRRNGEDIDIAVWKAAAADRLGIELRSEQGDRHPVVSSVADRFTQGLAAGKLVVGDVLVSVQAATASESMGVAATLGANGHASRATSQFLSSALGPITLEVERIKSKQARRASVTAAVARLSKATDVHESDGQAELTTIAASDVDSHADGEMLDKVGLSGVAASFPRGAGQQA